MHPATGPASTLPPSLSLDLSHEFAQVLLHYGELGDVQTCAAFLMALHSLLQTPSTVPIASSTSTASTSTSTTTAAAASSLPGSCGVCHSAALQLTSAQRLLAALPRTMCVRWSHAYLELLQRAQLWQCAAVFISRSPFAEVQVLNQNGTTLHTNCHRCRKALQRDRVRRVYSCPNCRDRTILCVVCQVPVNALYTWCQGCGHGGHLQHMRAWFADNSHCPSGCGHECRM
jgi:RING/Ubox like zinc-binding domain